MKRFLKNKLKSQSEIDESITDAMIGTGEHMCTCAAIVADIIVDQGQENNSFKDILDKMRHEKCPGDSATEKIP